MKSAALNHVSFYFMLKHSRLNFIPARSSAASLSRFLAAKVVLLDVRAQQRVEVDKPEQVSIHSLILAVILFPPFERGS